ncbi:alpha/beta fold hydrolase [Ilumatobacter nonamiensis]|uniref:alpha/beta fold hydrolase n=1 Tax=Ilumatobacter nonamiensis TaxID=467093 RepID=UPI000685BCEA|nr:alpha/beta fold hydrolase [Ilumatobacter nonamiensis]
MTALLRMERLSAVTHLVASAEHLASADSWKHGGLNNWNVARDATPVRQRHARRILDLASTPLATRLLHIARIGGALVLLAPVRSNRFRITANGVLAGSSLLLHPRHHHGTDGSDHVSFLVQSVSLVGRLGHRRPSIVDAALWTVALQSTMSYAVSGWVKLTSATWRRGEALPAVMRTTNYGDASLYRLLKSHPSATKATGAFVLAIESLFPVVFFSRGRLTKVFTGATAGMHLGIARAMGLGRFVPSFLSMHPAVLYTARPQTTLVESGGRRSDQTAWMFLAGSIGVGALAAAAAVRNDRIVRRGRGDECVLELDDGSRLSYRMVEHEDDSAPVVVFENGLLSTPEHWEWVARSVASTASVVTYHRAGYSSSTSDEIAVRTLDDRARQAARLVDHVAHGRPVVLVGHSLGGYLALKTLEHTSADVAAAVLVDSSHPDELDESERQRRGAELFGDNIAQIGRSLRLGSGLLLDVPDWVRTLPEPAQRTALAQYRNRRMWDAAEREWTATQHDFAQNTPLAGVATPLLVLSADATVRRDEVQGRLHEAFIDIGGPGSRIETVEGANHDTILTNQRYAESVGRRIVEFLGDRSSEADDEKRDRAIASDRTHHVQQDLVS